MTSPLQIVAEMASMTGMLFFASQVVLAPADDVLLLWCLAGGLCGSFCSLQFKPPKTRLEMGMQLAVNLILGATLSPLAVDCVSWLTTYPVNLKLTLPIAVGFGIGAQESVARLMPRIQAMLEKRAVEETSNLLGRGTSPPHTHTTPPTDQK
jgi:hypothetical protein